MIQPMGVLQFEIHSQSQGCSARAGRVTTAHGSFDTPAFMPVGTQGSVKGLQPDQVAQLGSQIVLANTYHLMLRPGSALIAEMGGLHRWMRWGRPILTDSGGFQVFSLSDRNQIDDDGVTFNSHIDGATIHLTPERSMQVQNELGADIIMAFDDCPPGINAQQYETSADDVADTQSHRDFDDADRAHVNQGDATLSQRATHEYTKRNEAACHRSMLWLERCVEAHRRPEEQALFGIVQGGLDLELRAWCAQRVAEYDLPGYAIGGVAVGEGYEGLKRVVKHTAPLMPVDRPRYLMGVGYERDILTAVRAGVDMFDCVLPTRNGRNSNAFTSTGQIRLKNARFTRDLGVIETGCDCPACGGGFSRGYLRHLFQSGEMLGPILVSMHNIRHFQRFMLDIREAIIQNDWPLIDRRWPVAATEDDRPQ